MELIKLKPIIAITTIIICVLLEYLYPAFRNSYKDRLRFNGFFYILNIIAMRIIFPLGLFHIAGQFSFPFSLNLSQFHSIFTIIIFDFLIYWQHRFFHIIPFLWKFHITHHSDLAMDFSNGFRFHPLEIIFSAQYKIFFLVLLAPTIEAYITYEIILHTMAIFNHSNIKLNEKLDSLLRIFIVTPSMHWPHHHPLKKYTNSNYGNFLSIWDKLFNTYTKDHTNEFGVDTVNDTDARSIKSLLLYPLKK